METVAYETETLEESKPSPEIEAPLFVTEKPMTREEVFKHLMTAKDIKAMTTSFVSGKTIEIPEIQQFQGKTAIKKPTSADLFAAAHPKQEQTPLKLITNTRIKRGPKQTDCLA